VDIDGYKTTWKNVSEPPIELIRSLLCVDPAKRLSAAGVLGNEWLKAKTARTPRAWVGKMRERSASGVWRKSESGVAQPSPQALDRGTGTVGEPPAKINTDAKMVYGEEHEGRMGHSLQHKGVVGQFSRWIVDRMFSKREMRILMVGEI